MTTKYKPTWWRTLSIRLRLHTLVRTPSARRQCVGLLRQRLLEMQIISGALKTSNQLEGRGVHFRPCWGVWRHCKVNWSTIARVTIAHSFISGHSVDKLQCSPVIDIEHTGVARQLRWLFCGMIGFRAYLLNESDKIYRLNPFLRVHTWLLHGLLLFRWHWRSFIALRRFYLSATLWVMGKYGWFWLDWKINVSGRNIFRRVLF